MKNLEMASHILQWLFDQGVRHICLCPGGRNSPFVEFLSEETPFQVHSSFDERSASFFALGLSGRFTSPVAIITTSGTAVAEVLPAIMESHYAGHPLIVISADRPRRLRGTGAPQSVDQPGLFGSYVENCVDLENDFVMPAWSGRRPLHINVCFDEPLLGGEAEPIRLGGPSLQAVAESVGEWRSGQVVPVERSLLRERVQAFLAKKSNPLLMVGTLTESEREAAKSLVLSWPGPVYCEGTSGLRELSTPQQLLSGDRILVKAWQDRLIDAVVRIGGVPTARLWRHLETSEFPLFSVSAQPFPGLARGEFFQAEIKFLVEDLRDFFSAHSAKASPLLVLDLKKRAQWQDLLSRFPNSEPAFMAWLSQQIPQEARVYLGNSLPIREWDLCASRENPVHVIANRGANGIDGQLSTALAFLDPQRPLWVVLGDLTALYDSNALWFWRKNPQALRIVIINNKGGQIFSRMFKSKLFRNEHDLGFSAWAAQWNLPHVQIRKSTPISLSSGLTEIVPDEQQTSAFWREYDQIWS